MTKLRSFVKHIPFTVSAYRGIKSALGYNWYFRDYARFRKLQRSSTSRFPLRWTDRYPLVGDKTSTTTFDSHYVYHPAWAARIVAEAAPAFHVDIGSILAFSTILSAFIPVKFYDYRPANLPLKNLESLPGDLMKLPFEDGTIKSLSCMHVIEHIGLGRYGDPLDPDGDLKAIAELKRVLAPGGQLLFVTPVGKPRIQFNAHRIYSYEQIAEALAPLTIAEFTLIPDDASSGLIENASPSLVAKQRYGCGCFRLVKAS